MILASGELSGEGRGVKREAEDNGPGNRLLTLRTVP